MEPEAVRRLGAYQNIVFLGETGSGKTELAVNLAERLATGGARVVFYDMDQTKPLLRARDCAARLAAAGVELRCQAQYLDAPTVASGVREALADPGARVLLDVGGGAQGARMIGQFAHILGRPESLALYILNPYRAWSGSAADMEETARRVTGAARLRRLRLAANPNLGPGTTAADVLEGLRRLRERLPGADFLFLAALAPLCAAVAEKAALPVLPIRLGTVPEWLAGSGPPAPK